MCFGSVPAPLKEEYKNRECRESLRVLKLSFFFSFFFNNRLVALFEALYLSVSFVSQQVGRKHKRQRNIRFRFRGSQQVSLNVTKHDTGSPHGLSSVKVTE